jgi:hypothetical protein
MFQVNDKFDNEQQSNGVLKQFVEMLRCALGDNDHIYREPISLSCGHCVCKKCIPEDDDEITCKVCGDKNKYDLNDSKVSAIAQFSIQSNIERLTCLTKQKLKNLFNQLEGSDLLENN